MNSALEELKQEATRRADMEAAAYSRNGAGPVDSLSWEFFTLGDAYKPRPPIDYFVDGIFAAGSLNIVYGAPGTMKSLLLNDMLACIAAGVDWLPPLPEKKDVMPIKTQQAPVLWVDVDNGRRIMHERFEAIGRARGLPDITPLFYVSMPEPWPDASKPGFVASFGQTIDRLGAKIAVVDNFANITGGVSENDPEIGNVMANLRRLTESLQIALILVHHQRKGDGARGRAGDRLRGHSSIEAALDLALLVERKDGAQSVTVRETKARQVGVMPFEALFAYDHKPGVHELETAKFFGLPSDDIDSDPAVLMSIKDTVTHKPGVHQGELVTKVKAACDGKPGINRIRKLAGFLVDTGALSTTGGNGMPLCYYPK